MRSLLLLTVLASALAAASPCLGGHDEVVTPGANQRYTGVYQATPVKTLTGARWSFETAGNASGTVVVADGTAFFGCSEGNLYAVDTETGEIHDIPWDTLQVQGVESWDDFEIQDYQVVLRGRKK